VRKKILLRNSWVALIIAVAASVVTAPIAVITVYYPLLSIIGALAYIIGGFCFLKPVDRHSYLSVGFVFVAWLILTVILVIVDAGDGGIAYILVILNPFSLFLIMLLSWAAVTVGNHGILNLLYVAVFLLPPLIPSLLIWIGLLLKTRVCILKIRRENRET
jgi:hypothetical protein